MGRDWALAHLPPIGLRLAPSDAVGERIYVDGNTAAGLWAGLLDRRSVRLAGPVLLGYAGGEPVAFALFFYNYSTFLGRPGIYLEDLYVKPELRGKGVGRALLAYLALIILVVGIIPACRWFERRWLHIGDDAAHDAVLLAVGDLQKTDAAALGA